MGRRGRRGRQTFDPCTQMGHSSEWVCWKGLPSEQVIQANGSFQQIGHSTEWVIRSFNWMGLLKGAFKSMGHSSKWVISVNGSFNWMGDLIILLNGSAERGFQVNGLFKWMGHLSEWEVNGASKCIIVFWLGVGGSFRCFVPFTDNFFTMVFIPSSPWNYIKHVHIK